MASSLRGPGEPVTRLRSSAPFHAPFCSGLSGPGAQEASELARGHLWAISGRLTPFAPLPACVNDPLRPPQVSQVALEVRWPGARAWAPGLLPLLGAAGKGGCVKEPSRMSNAWRHVSTHSSLLLLLLSLFSRVRLCATP